MTIQKVTIEEFTENTGVIRQPGKPQSSAVAAMLQLEVGEALKITDEHKHYQLTNPYYKPMCSVYTNLLKAARNHDMKISARCVDGTVWVLRTV